MKSKGKAGEDMACRLFIKKGYEILERNYHSRYGEVDIIARDGEYIVFAEVKARQYGSAISGRAAVDSRKQKKLIMTSAVYLQQLEEELQPRYDVVEVRLSGDGVCGIDHIEFAFDTEGVFGF